MEINDLKALIVDDHMIMRGLISKYLAEAGIQRIAEATNGSEALEKIEGSLAEGSPYNLLLVDWNMPVMNGLTLLKKIREKKECAKTAFLMITAESEKARILEALEAGATAYIVKPFAQEELTEHVEKIRQWLTERS